MSSAPGELPEELETFSGGESLQLAPTWLNGFLRVGVSTIQTTASHARGGGGGVRVRFGGFTLPAFRNLESI